MSENNKYNSIILGVCLVIGLALLGLLLGNALIKFKHFERTVTVKGLSEREYKADIVIWPIQFTTASNNLEDMYISIDSNSDRIRTFLQKAGIDNEEITISTPAIVDKSAQQYGSESNIEFRYIASQTVTVYSKNIETVRQLMGKLSELGKQGIVLTGAENEHRVQGAGCGVRGHGDGGSAHEHHPRTLHVPVEIAIGAKCRVGRVYAPVVVGEAR